MLRPIKAIKIAFPCVPKQIPVPISIHAKNGIRYEKKVVKVLKLNYPSTQYNPWFFFEDKRGSGHIVPDAIIEHEDKLIIIEIKLTYKPEAIIKLRNLYCPIVSYALNKQALPLVITKNLIPISPLPAFSIKEALNLKEPLLHWNGKVNLI